MTQDYIEAPREPREPRKELGTWELRREGWHGMEPR
jgi:hypothetical protein